MMRFEDKIYAYALKNAIEHKGEAKEGNVLNSLFHEGLEKKDIKKILPKIKKETERVNKLDLGEQKKEFADEEKKISHRKGREGLSDLPRVNRKKGVIMRISPSPSGPLHIGHALTAVISFLYVQKYKGKFYVRIEDTNPENIYKPAYKMIKQDAEWLFKKKAKIIIQSERMNLYYKYAEKLLKLGKAYVCTCKSEDFKEFVKNKKECECRNKKTSEHLERWEKMLSNSKDKFKEGEAVLRFVSSMQDKNPAFRDFPLARINETKHALQGKKYRVWPLMNLAVAVDDVEQKMTHVIRAKDHRDNAKRQEMIFKALGKEKNFPWVGFLGRWHFKDLTLSTTKMRQDIENGKYTGWDDKRLPSLISLRKQGYKPEAFYGFAEQVGLSEVDKVIDKKEFFELLDTFNKKKQ